MEEQSIGKWVCVSWICLKTAENKVLETPCAGKGFFWLGTKSWTIYDIYENFSSFEKAPLNFQLKTDNLLDLMSPIWTKAMSIKWVTFIPILSEVQCKLDIIVMGTITGAPLLPFYVLVTEAWNVSQGHKQPRGLSRSCQDEQLV